MNTNFKQIFFSAAHVLLTLSVIFDDKTLALNYSRKVTESSSKVKLSAMR